MDLQKLLFNFYFILIAAIGNIIFAKAITLTDWNLYYLYFIWIALFVCIEMRPISLDVKGQVSLSFALNLVLLMIYGLWFSILVSGVGSALADIFGKRGWQKAIFNTAQYSISLFVAGLLYYRFSPLTEEVFDISAHIIPFVVAASSYVLVNFILVAIIVSLSFKIPLITVIKMDLAMMALFLVSLAPMSLLMVILYTNEPWSIILILPPLALAHNGFENYLKLRKQTRDTIELLADVVDRRDPYTASHSYRVAHYAKKIAQEMKLPYEQVEKISMAGRVHDLGKIAVVDDILKKREQLTENEYSEMKVHSEIGFKILSPLDMYKDLLSYVLYHHERFDGRGYPRGLTNSNIPIGARILAVADSFDAMTSDRPYRKAMSEEEAVNEILKNRGIQFDPEVVNAFIKVIEKERKARGET